MQNTVLYVNTACYEQYRPKISKVNMLYQDREAKKKQHACTSSGPRDHYSELFTRMAALNFLNAVTQPL